MLFHIYLHIRYACNINSLVVLGMRSRKVRVSECVGGVNVSVHLQMFGRLGNLCVCLLCLSATEQCYTEYFHSQLFPSYFQRAILFSPCFSVLLHTHTHTFSQVSK